MRAPPVTWICGPPGVGKSTVGWQLFAQWASRGRTIGYLDIDQLAMRSPPDPAPDAATHTKAANLAAVLPNYTAAGAERIVVTGVATPADVHQFEEAIGAVRWVRLTADRAELHHRFTHRDGPAAMLPEVDRHADELDASTFAELVISTSGSTPIEIAERLDDLKPPSGQHTGTDPSELPNSPRHPHRLDDAGAHVLVITGPRAVGTSTVGWELFSHNLVHGPTAFIDLAQIGFISTGTDLRARNLALRAANLAAMVEVYQRQGCRLIIAAGAVLNTEERDFYAARIAPTPHSLIRISASSDQLEHRIGARTAPTGGPHLAGDDLRGQSGAAVSQVLNQALREAEQLERSDFADRVIDTSKLSASQVAERILGFLTHLQ